MTVSFVYVNEQAILTMRNQCMSWPEIARALDYPGKTNVLINAWNRHAKRKGLPVALPHMETMITEEMVKDCYDNQYSYSQMHLKYGFFHKAWRNAFKKYGYEFPKRERRKFSVDRDRIKELLLKDLTVSEVAILCDCSKQTVIATREEMIDKRDPELMPLSAYLPPEVRKIALGPWV